MFVVGAKVNKALDSDAMNRDGLGFSLGDRLVDSDGKEFIFVQAAEDITGDGYVLVFDEDYQASMLDTDNDDLGGRVGIARAAASEGEYLWAQIYGAGDFRVASDTTAATALTSTATAGVLATAGGLYISGIVKTETGDLAANYEGVCNYPQVAIPQPSVGGGGSI